MDPSCFDLSEFTETWLIYHEKQLPKYVVGGTLDLDKLYKKFDEILDNLDEKEE